MANDPTIRINEQAGGPSTSASGSGDLPQVAIPEAVWPGMTLNWSSPLREILLHVELPFWLLMADCSLRVTVGGCTLELSITGRAIEIQRGKAYGDSHSSTAIIEKVEGKPSDRAAAILEGMKQSGFTLRTTRTLISIHTNVLEDALAAVQEGGRLPIAPTLGRPRLTLTVRRCCRPRSFDDFSPKRSLARSGRKCQQYGRFRS
jgi:hypothetical protein